MFCIEMTLYIFFNPACPELHLPFEHSFNYFVKVSSERRMGTLQINLSVYAISVSEPLSMLFIAPVMHFLLYHPHPV